MEESLYEEMYRQETGLWWHVGKRELVRTYLMQLHKNKRRRYLDAGCGTGAMMLEMLPYFRSVYGLDMSTEALNFCRKRKLTKVTQADLETKLPYPANYFDAITALDIVEHIKRDSFFITELYRLLQPGGKLIVTVPAYRSLWTYWDVKLGHKRRYRLEQIQSLLTAAGFNINRITYFNSFLLAAVPIRQAKNFLGANQSDFINLPGPLNFLMSLATTFERQILKIINLPAGISILAVAEKKAHEN